MILDFRFGSAAGKHGTMQTASSTPPDLNCLALEQFGPVIDFFFPGGAGAPVEDEEVAGVGAAVIHVGGGLLQAGFDDFFQGLPQDFQFDDFPLDAARVGPLHVQVGAAPAQAVLPVNAPAAINDALKEGLHEQLGSRFVVLEALQPAFGMFPEELLEGGEEFGHIEPAIREHIPGLRLMDERLRVNSQFSWDDFLVNGIFDSEGFLVVALDEAEVHTILDIIGLDGFDVALCLEDRLDDPFHPFLPEFVNELVEVGIPAEDEVFFRLFEDRAGDRRRAVLTFFHAEAGFVSQGVYEPGLSAGVFINQFPDFVVEGLAGGLCVLGVEVLDVFFGEIAKAERFGLDVEGAAAGDDLPGVGRVDAVVPHVPHAAEDDGGWEMFGAACVPGPQLAQQGDEGIADKGVHLVEQEDDGLASLF